MSSNESYMIDLGNYEEWFVLYMDNELTGAQKAMVENFVRQHPHLQSELDLLLSAKLPVDDITFPTKEDLLAGAMKLNVVDESLLLYLDNELPAAERSAVEEKISADQNIRFQYTLLQQTKFDAKEVIPYPDKKELYRHTERAVVFSLWMRVAVAVVLILFATIFFVLDSGKEPVQTSVATTIEPKEQRTTPQADPLPETLPSMEQATTRNTVAVNTKPAGRQPVRPGVNAPVATPPQEKVAEENLTASAPAQTAPLEKIEGVKLDVARLTAHPAVAVNNFSANPAVTSATPASYNPTDNPEETAGSDGDYKGSRRTSAKGFLRKVSRFIERRAGIGTVNADNELLVGAVAFKLN